MRTTRVRTTVAVLLALLLLGAGEGTVTTGGSAEQPNGEDLCPEDVLGTRDRDLCAMWVQGHWTGVPDAPVLERVTFAMRLADDAVLAPTAHYTFRWVDELGYRDPDHRLACQYKVGVRLGVHGPEASFAAQNRDSSSQRGGMCGWRGMVWQLGGMFGVDHVDASTAGLTAEVDGDVVQVTVDVKQSDPELRAALETEVLHGLTAETSLDGLQCCHSDDIPLADPVDLSLPCPYRPDC